MQFILELVKSLLIPLPDLRRPRVFAIAAIIKIAWGFFQ